MWLCCRFRNFRMFNRFAQHLAGWIDHAFRESSGQSDDDSTGPNFMCPCLLLDSVSLVQFCAGSGWLFEAIWQGRQRCLVQGRIARSDARRGVWFVEFPWDGLSWSTFGRNSDDSEDLLILGCSGIPATCVQEESARSSRWEKLRREATWNLQISQANKLKKNVFSLVHL